MDRELERMQADSNAEMLSSMMSLCREKTLKKSHNSDSLADDEKKQFANCLMKFFETPNHIMSAMGQMGN